MSMRVDDIMVISSAEFIKEFSGKLKKHVKLKLDGPRGQS